MSKEPPQLDATGRPLPSSECPDCGYVVDAATHPFDQQRRPAPGDLSMCLNCTQFLRFDDDMRLVVFPPAELRRLPEKIRDLLFKMRRVAQEVTNEVNSRG